MSLDFLNIYNVKLLYPAFIFFPLLYFIRFFVFKKPRTGVPYGSIPALRSIAGGFRAKLRTPVLFLLSFSFICLLSLAAARPQIIDEVITPSESRNLMLTIDLSGSMGTVDFRSAFGQVNRLEAVKAVVSEFVRERSQDRIGLVVFGTNAFLQSPLTLDHNLLLEMLDRLQVGVAGEDTAIGDGLGLSLKRIQDIEGSSKAIILVTDGVNRTGEVNPIKAANIAKDLGVKIHTIGIGSKEQSRQGPFGIILRGGQAAEFDEATLKKIAEITGGVYHNASSLEGLKKVYNEIDKLEKTENDDPNKQIVYELFPVICLAALGIYLLLILLSRSYFLKVPL
jgi:Ca-activated chloride channel family protein